jgi:hypothetical protein
MTKNTCSIPMTFREICWRLGAVRNIPVPATAAGSRPRKEMFERSGSAERRRWSSYLWSESVHLWREIGRQKDGQDRRNKHKHDHEEFRSAV